MSQLRCLAAAIVATFCVSLSAQNLPAVISECEACHGPRGVSTQNDIPTLAGRDPEVLVGALEEFYYYERPCPTTTYRHGDHEKVPVNMCSVANTLSPADRRAVASHFAAQAPLRD